MKKLGLCPKPTNFFKKSLTKNFRVILPLQVFEGGALKVWTFLAVSYIPAVS